MTDQAANGNVEQTAQLVGTRYGAPTDITLALGFGTTQAAAVSTAGATLATARRRLTCAPTQAQWQRYDAA